MAGLSCATTRRSCALVARLTRTMEAGGPAPWKMGDAPADFLSQMLDAPPAF
jgi:predicted FMN-binding regulatory protein PaiB